MATCQESGLRPAWEMHMADGQHHEFNSVRSLAQWVQRNSGVRITENSLYDLTQRVHHSPAVSRQLQQAGIAWITCLRTPDRRILAATASSTAAGRMRLMKLQATV